MHVAALSVVGRGSRGMAAGLLDQVGGFAALSVAACKCCAPLAPAAGAPRDEAADDAALVALADAEVFDSHCHTFRGGGPRRGYVGVVQAVEEADWPAVLAAAASTRALVPGLGVHPWQAHLVDDVAAYAARLERAVAAHPAAIVGEIGLCKCAKNARGPTKSAGLAAQRAVFAAGLAVAAKLGRPASVHAVKQHAPLKAALAAIDGAPRVALHSFSGTAHHVADLLAVGTSSLFFGFSHTINVEMNGSRGLDALKKAIAAVPADRLLVESDVDDAVLSGVFSFFFSRRLRAQATARAATCRAVALVAVSTPRRLVFLPSRGRRRLRRTRAAGRSRRPPRGPPPTRARG